MVVVSVADAAAVAALRNAKPGDASTRKWAGGSDVSASAPVRVTGTVLGGDWSANDVKQHWVGDQLRAGLCAGADAVSDAGAVSGNDQAVRAGSGGVQGLRDQVAGAFPARLRR